MSRFDLKSAFFGGPGFTLYHAWGSNSEMPLTPHFHDEYLICAQLQGSESFEISGKLQQFDPGDLVLINPQQVHTGNAEGHDDLEYLSLYVDPHYVRTLARSLQAAAELPEFTVIRAADQWPLIEHLRRLHALVRDEGDADAAELQAALEAVVRPALEQFSNLRQPMLRSTNRVTHRKIAKAMEHIRGLDSSVNPTSLSLDELAEIAGLSKYHFLRQFSQTVGITPGAYLRTLRLCHAARKLRTSAQPILDIALSVGFADHPSFSRAFARHMGMTPSEYQKLGPL